MASSCDCPSVPAEYNRKNQGCMAEQSTEAEEMKDAWEFVAKMCTWSGQRYQYSPQQPPRSPTNNTLKVCRNIEILYNGEKMRKKTNSKETLSSWGRVETDVGTEAIGKNLCDHGRVLIE